MSPDGSIQVERLWKRFRGDRHRRLLRDHVQILTNATGRRRDWRWALRDVSFTVEPGDAVGLFGMNGSGKSTLLKILGRVMYPYAGAATAKGRVGALIEVRSGIHPDLTGVENIYFYGSMLGLRRREVAKRLDQIVDFAELEDAVDRQLKFYSTGMQMRLGFAVAAFLEPSILLVDEVLAVGDGAFQQKCLNRMSQVLADGTTLIYVSHDLATIEATCSRGIWLRDGVIEADGTLRESLSLYRSYIEQPLEMANTAEGPLRIASATVIGPTGNGIVTNASVKISVVFETQVPRGADIYLGVTEGGAAPIFVLRRDTHLSAGRTVLHCTVGMLPLPHGRYCLWVGAMERGRTLLAWRPVARFPVWGPPLDRVPPGVVRLTPLQVAADWEISRS